MKRLSRLAVFVKFLDISGHATPLGLVFVIFCHIDISAYAAPLDLVFCYILLH